MNINFFSVAAIATACAYYLFAWALYGSHEMKGTVMPIYDPPHNLSPGMLRYTCKEHFDDRVFWASVLSLVSKELATLESSSGGPILKPTKSAEDCGKLPPEEHLLLQRLLGHHKRKGLMISMLDWESAFLAGQMADVLRKIAVGRWFNDNRKYLWGGGLISLVAICILARPDSVQRWIAFAFGLGVMAPGAFYLVFLLLRVRDLIHALRQKLSWTTIRRTAGMLWLMLPCLAGIVVGCVIIGANFGWVVLAVAGFLSLVNLAFMHFFKILTAEGKQLLNQIEGFRLFLHSVERYPMDRADAPQNQAGIYEKYLPYAIALEVEQQWADKYVAIESTVHQNEAALGAHSFYLGMWNDKPVELIFRPEPLRKSL